MKPPGDISPFFERMVSEDREAFRHRGAARADHRGTHNALLSFLYTLLLGDCVSAAEGVGLDPQVGFCIVCVRPAGAGLRPDGGLRPVLADRLALTLINRRQVTAGLRGAAGGGYSMNERLARRWSWPTRSASRTKCYIRMLDQKVPLGLVPHAAGAAPGPTPPRRPGVVSAVCLSMRRAWTRWTCWWPTTWHRQCRRAAATPACGANLRQLRAAGAEVGVRVLGERDAVRADEAAHLLDAIDEQVTVCDSTACQPGGAVFRVFRDAAMEVDFEGPLIV